MPIPQLELDLVVPEVSYRSSPLTVATEFVTVPGFAEPHTPARYNQSYYLRYFRPEDELDTVFVLMPGIFGGATSVDALARQLVASTPGLEVWAVDRRANALEDRSVMVESLQKRDPGAAYRYYIEAAGTPSGFNALPPEKVQFMGYWGLDVHLRDLHAAVLDAEAQADTVILAGHSLGASLVGFYAAYDFADAGAPADAGHEHIDGLVLLDGALGRTGGFSIGESMTALLSLLPDRRGLETGTDAPYLTFGISPQFQAQRESLALLARYRPEDLVPPGILSFPATNRAALGVTQDDDYSGATVFSSSLGRAVGAQFSGNLGAFFLGGSLGASSRSVVGVAPGHSVVDWERGDPDKERSSVAALARSWATPDSNRTEWYFPLRLALDIGELDFEFTETPGFVPNTEVLTPTLAVGAGRGLGTSLASFQAYSNARPGSFFSSYILDGFTHLDIVEAENNPLVSLLKRWLTQVERVSGR